MTQILHTTCLNWIVLKGNSYFTSFYKSWHWAGRWNCPLLLPWLLMAWWQMEPGHQQEWYWQSLHGVNFISHTERLNPLCLNKMAIFCKQCFQAHYLKWKWLYFDLISLRVNKVSFSDITYSSGDGLMPDWQQAIIWANDNQINIFSGNGLVPSVLNNKPQCGVTAHCSRP